MRQYGQLSHSGVTSENGKNRALSYYYLVDKFFDRTRARSENLSVGLATIVRQVILETM